MKSLTNSDSTNLRAQVLQYIENYGVIEALKVVREACEQSIDETVDVDELDRSPGYIACSELDEVVYTLENT